MITRRFPIRSFFLAAPTCAFFVLCIRSAAAVAEPPQGRPIVQVPVGPNVTQAASAASGVSYETQRIKRTVPLDGSADLDGRWDTLYSVQDGSGGARTTYLDWDDTYLYIAVETANPVEVRIDIDGRNDGWLRGADNLSLDITPPAADTAVGAAAAAPQITAQRFDMAQNKEQPVWAGSPIAVSRIRVAGGKTSRGSYAIRLAIPDTDAIGLSLKGGATFGIRVDSGTPKLAPSADEAIAIPVRPMLRVGLSDAVEASGGGLTAVLSVNGPHDITPSGNVKTTLEIRNEGPTVRRVTRMFIRGSLNDSDFVDESKFAGTDIAPGKSVKRDLESTVSPAAPNGSIVLSGGADLDDGTTVAGLTSFNRVEPYLVYIETDNKPIPAGGDNGSDPVRTVKVFVRSRMNARTTANIHLKLPDGWKLQSGSLDNSLALVRDGDVQFYPYKFVVPASAVLGVHPISANVDIGGHTYSASATVVIAQ